MNERRSARRLPRSEKTTLISQAQQDRQVELIDISTGGMRLYSSEEIPEGTMVNSQLSLTPDIGAFYLRGKVIWNKPSSRGSGYEVGVTFTRISAAPI